RPGSFPGGCRRTPQAGHRTRALPARDDGIPRRAMRTLLQRVPFLFVRRYACMWRPIADVYRLGTRETRQLDGSHRTVKDATTPLAMAGASALAGRLASESRDQRYRRAKL